MKLKQFTDIKHIRIIKVYSDNLPPIGEHYSSETST